MNSFCFFNTVDAWGGGEKWHLEIANHLKLSGHKVFIITRPESELSIRATTFGIDVFHVKLSNLSFINPFLINRLVNEIRKRSVQTIVLNLSRDLKCGGIASKIAGVKNIIFRRGSDRSVRNYFFNRFLYQKIITGILTNSNATKNSILSKGISLVAPKKIKVIYNGINIDEFKNKKFNSLGLKNRGFLILAAMGRLAPQKNFEFLIPVALNLKKRGLAFKIIIAGSGPQENYLKSIVNENNLDKELIFLGFINNSKDLLMSADIFLLPSLWEGFGYVLIEASLSRLPIIAFDTSSNSEVVSKTSGFLTPTNQVKPFCDKIEYLFFNKKVRLNIGKNGEAHVRKNFDSVSIFKKIEKYLIGDNN